MIMLMINFMYFEHFAGKFLVILQGGGHENTISGGQGDTIVYSCTQYGRPCTLWTFRAQVEPFKSFYSASIFLSEPY